MPARSTPVGAPQPRRADAQRNVARILDAAVEELADDHDASMAAIARRAGVVRATIYVHFPTREALIAAVTDRAIADSAAAISGADPQSGEPAEALGRVVAAAWRMLGRYHALVAINARLGPERLRELHEPVLGQIAPIVERGRRSGAFDASVPLHWQLTVVLELVHAASREVSAGRMSADVAERALVASVVGALAP